MLTYRILIKLHQRGAHPQRTRDAKVCTLLGSAEAMVMFSGQDGDVNRHSKRIFKIAHLIERGLTDGASDHAHHLFLSRQRTGL
jgi:hypothetical protein